MTTDFAIGATTTVVLSLCALSWVFSERGSVEAEVVREQAIADCVLDARSTFRSTYSSAFREFCERLVKN